MAPADQALRDVCLTVAVDVLTATCRGRSGRARLHGHAFVLVPDVVKTWSHRTFQKTAVSSYAQLRSLRRS